MTVMRTYQESPRGLLQRRALSWYLTALLVLGVGVTVAARAYPGGFDWPYMVASALASRTRNPAGSVWFAGALMLSMVLLWPCVSILKQRLRPSASVAAKVAIDAVQFALAAFALAGVDMLLNRSLSDRIYKSHEILVLAAFLGAYFGVLGLLVQVVRRQGLYALPALLVASPLLAIGITQLWLYLKQRNLGWVGPSWRAMEIPFWLSFAFWQWLAIAFLLAGLGLLVWGGLRDRNAVTASRS